jgi:hypothetical protein
MKHGDDKGGAARGKPGRRRDEGKMDGLWIDGELLRNDDLILSERIVLAFLRYRADKEGEYWAHDAKAARECGMPEATFKRCMGGLKKRGLLKGRKGNGSRMRVGMSPEWYAERGLPDGRNLQDEAQNDTDEAQNDTDEAQNDTARGSFCTHAEAQNEPRIRIKDINKRDEEEDDDKQSGQSSSSSSSFLLKEVRRVADSWAKRVSALTGSTVVSKPSRSGEHQECRIEASHPGVSRQDDCKRLLSLAREIWPEADPVMAFRHLLDACSATRDDVLRLQTWGSFHGNAISCRGLVSIGEELDFVLERAKRLGDPPPPVSTEGDQGTADEFRDMLDTCSQFGGSAWTDCWVEASARASASGLPIEQFASIANIKARELGNGVMLPLVVCRTDRPDVEKYMPFYSRKCQREWAPPGDGSTRDPRSYCMGARLARAVASGQTEGLEHRSCLICAANDLEHVTSLVEHVPQWRGSAQELAQKLREAAEKLNEDAYPGDNDYCRNIDLMEGSVKRCLLDRKGPNPIKRWLIPEPYDYERRELEAREATLKESAALKAMQEAAFKATIEFSEFDEQPTQETPQEPTQEATQAVPVFDEQAFLARIRSYSAAAKAQGAVAAVFTE